MCGFENDSVRDSSWIAKAPNCENVFSLKITESNLGCQVNVKIKVRSIIILQNNIWFLLVNYHAKIMYNLLKFAKFVLLKSFFGIKNQPNLSNFFSVKNI